MECLQGKKKECSFYVYSCDDYVALLSNIKKTPQTTQWVKIITDQEPTSFDNFIQANKKQLQS